MKNPRESREVGIFRKTKTNKELPGPGGPYSSVSGFRPTDVLGPNSSVRSSGPVLSVDKMLIRPSDGVGKIVYLLKHSLCHVY